ncbi:MAG TPA: hypothetical protein VII95_21005 [Terriglobales bacterium]
MVFPVKLSFSWCAKRSLAMHRQQKQRNFGGKNGLTGAAKSLPISLLQVIYDLFGMGKIMIFGYNTHRASFAANTAATLVIRPTWILNGNTVSSSQQFAFKN